MCPPGRPNSEFRSSQHERPLMSAQPSSTTAAQTPSTAGATTTLTLDAAFNMAMAHQSAGRLAPAEQIYNSILQVVPDQPRALYWLGAIALRLDRHGVAEQRFRAVLRQRPNNIVAVVGVVKLALA